MRRIIDFFRGTCRVSLESPWPERVLGRINRSGISLWDLSREETRLLFTVYARDLLRLQEVCALEGASLTAQRCGFRRSFRGLQGRWTLLFGLAAVIALVLTLQDRIWYLEVEGNEQLQPQQILESLEEIGIGPGTKAKALDGQEIKNQMLALLPELEWISVNKRGAYAQVLVHERDEKPELHDPKLAANIVAARAGLITSMEVYSGFPVTEVGKSVLEGELLVSGMGSGWQKLVFRSASAEIFATTSHESVCVLPAISSVRTGMGREKTYLSLIIGKKRWNFYEKSGISLTGYDKIESVYECSLPGGICLPISLVKTVCRAYDAGSEQLDQETAFALLSEAETARVKRSMVAGTVLDTEAELSCDDGLYRYHAITEASEMIARTVYINPLEQ